jgi:hypothetical protein
MGLRRRVCRCFAFFSLLPLLAHAAPITWSLENAVFQTGGSESFASLSGSFRYDSATNLYSHIDLTSEAGSLFICLDGNGDNVCDGAPSPTPIVEASYGDSSFEGGGALGLRLSFFTDLTQAQRRILFLSFTDPLSVADRTFLRVAGEFVCSTPNCANIDVDVTPFRSTPLNGGALVVAAVPEPGTLMLVCLGLFGIGFARRKPSG